MAAGRHTMSVCQREGCDTPLTPSQRKWCSENCRKRACDASHRATCVDCGKPMADRSGWRHNDWPNDRHQACENARRTALRLQRVGRVAEMYNAGLTMREIARALGYGENSKPPEVTAARKLGLIGYRNRGYEQVAA